MENKKSSKANLEKDISLNFLMGIVVGLAILFVGFEWGEKDIEVATYTGVANIIIEDEIEASVQDEPPPPPPEPEIPKEMEIITIVEDNIEVESIDFTSEDDIFQAQVEVYTPSSGIGDVEEDTELDQIFELFAVEKLPSFPGDLNKWLQNNLSYPTIAVENGLYGIVYYSFVVNIDGSIVDLQLVRGPNTYLNREAERVIKIMPNWIPGEQMGKPVRVRFTLPIKFELQTQ